MQPSIHGGWDKCDLSFPPSSVQIIEKYTALKVADINSDYEFHKLADPEKEVVVSDRNIAPPHRYLLSVRNRMHQMFKSLDMHRTIAERAPSSSDATDGGEGNADNTDDEEDDDEANDTADLGERLATGKAWALDVFLDQHVAPSAQDRVCPAAKQDSFLIHVTIIAERCSSKAFIEVGGEFFAAGCCDLVRLLLGIRGVY